MTEENIKRMNCLYHKSKEKNGLTEEEKTEQKALRNEYIKCIRANLRCQLDNVSIQEKDGSVTNLGEKYGEKLKPDQSK